MPFDMSNVICVIEHVRILFLQYMYLKGQHIYTVCYVREAMTIIDYCVNVLSIMK